MAYLPWSKEVLAFALPRRNFPPFGKTDKGRIAALVREFLEGKGVKWWVEKCP